MPNAYDHHPPEGPGLWINQGQCKGVDTAMFYPEAHSPLPEPYRDARAVCKDCPVLEQCLDYALSLPVAWDFGMWGGLTPRQRQALRKNGLRAKDVVR